MNVAARIQALADPGGIYISRGAAEQVRDKVPIKIETRGEQAVKNIARPIEVFCIIAEDRDAIAKSMKKPRPGFRPPMVADKPTIAVLPFVNMSGEPEQGFFADGITEDILTELSRFRELFVISRNSAFVYKGKQVNVQKVAKELGVQYVVEGSVRKAGRRVRITVQLIDAETDGHLWAERYDRELADIFAIQDEVTSSIVSILPGRVAAAAHERVQRKPPKTQPMNACSQVSYYTTVPPRRPMKRHCGCWSARSRSIPAMRMRMPGRPACSDNRSSMAGQHHWSDTSENSLPQAERLISKSISKDDKDPFRPLRCRHGWHVEEGL